MTYGRNRGEEGCSFNSEGERGGGIKTDKKDGRTMRNERREREEIK